MDSIRCSIGGEFIIIGGSADLRHKKRSKKMLNILYLSLSLSLFFSFTNKRRVLERGR